MFYFIYLFYLFPLTYISCAYLCECVSVISCSHSCSLTLLPLTLIAHSGSCGAGRHRLKHLSTSPFIPQSGSERQESCLNSPTWLLLDTVELAYAGTFLFLFFFFYIFQFSPSVHGWADAVICPMICSWTSFVLWPLLEQKQYVVSCLGVFLPVKSPSSVIRLTDSTKVSPSHRLRSHSSRVSHTVATWGNLIYLQRDVQNIEINTHIITGCVIVLIKLDLDCCSLKLKPERNTTDTLLRLCA